MDLETIAVKRGLKRMVVMAKLGERVNIFVWRNQLRVLNTFKKLFLETAQFKFKQIFTNKPVLLTLQGTWTPTFKACLKGKERSAKHIRNVASFDDCKLECEKDLTCKSILYGEENKLCNLFIFNRQSAPEYFQAPCRHVYLNPFFLLIHSTEEGFQ